MVYIDASGFDKPEDVGPNIPKAGTYLFRITDGDESFQRPGAENAVVFKLAVVAGTTPEQSGKTIDWFLHLTDNAIQQLVKLAMVLNLQAPRGSSEIPATSFVGKFLVATLQNEAKRVKQTKPDGTEEWVDSPTETVVRVKWMDFHSPNSPDAAEVMRLPEVAAAWQQIMSNQQNGQQQPAQPPQQQAPAGMPQGQQQYQQPAPQQPPFDTTPQQPPQGQVQGQQPWPQQQAPAGMPQGQSAPQGQGWDNI